MLLLVGGCSHTGSPGSVEPGGIAPTSSSSTDVGDPRLQNLILGTDGSYFALTELRGHALMVVFFSTWCMTCPAELQALDSVQKEFAAERLLIVPIAVDDDPARVKAMKESLHLSLRLATDTTGNMKRDFEVTGLPLAVGFSPNLRPTQLVDPDTALPGTEVAGFRHWSTVEGKRAIRGFLKASKAGN